MEVSLGHSSPVDYRIVIPQSAVIDGQVVDLSATLFSGRAWARPGTTEVVTRVNDICSGYLSSPFPALAHLGLTEAAISETFKAQTKGASGAWVDAGNAFTLVRDWSCDRGRTDWASLNAPINGRLTARSWLMRSFTGQKSVSIVVTRKGGAKTTATATASDICDGTAVFDLSKYTDPVSVAAGDDVYTIADGGGARYALYYLNAYGGWDALLIEGAVKEADALTRSVQGVAYDNADPAARGEREYLCEIERRWTLVTGWMTDAQSARMRHLTESTDVYLCDLDTREFRAVLIEDTAAEVKSYKGNGGQLVNYTLTARLAQGRTRR